MDIIKVFQDIHIQKADRANTTRSREILALRESGRMANTYN